MSTEPEDGAVVTVRTGLARGAPPEVYRRCDDAGDGERHWFRLDAPRVRPLAWPALRRRGLVQLLQPRPEEEPEGAYPTCGTCGHNTSGVLADHCTTFVPFDNGGSDYGARYCNCRCVDDPAVARWLQPRA